MEATGKAARKRAALDKDWTQGSIIGNLFSLVWPMSINTTINTLGPTIDMIWVGRLGAAAIAGVGIAGMLVMLVDSLKMGLDTGLRAVVARTVGTGDTQTANHAGQQSFVVSLAYSALVAVIGIFLAKPILIAFGLSPDVVGEAAAYMRIMFVGRVTMSMWMTCSTIMQASGDAIAPLKISVALRLFHMALSPFLIFGWWVFPQLGVSGAALTNIFSQGLGAIFGLWVLFSGASRLRLTLRGFRFDPGMIWRMVRIGIPASIGSVERSIGSTVIVWLTVPFGTDAVAANTVCDRVDMVLSVPPGATGNAAGVLAAQNLGAKQPERAAKTVWLAAAMGEGLMAALSLVLLFSPQSVARIFGSEPEFIRVASIFLRIMVAYFVVEGLRMVFNQSLNSVGDTMPPMVFALLSRWLVYVPLALFLSRYTSLGVLGIRWGMVINSAVHAFALIVYFSLGRWKNKRV
jgi:putative MATE family efflux protein